MSFIKKIFLLIAFFFVGVNVFAQTPLQASYQAIIRDAKNNVVTNTTVGMRVSLLRGSETGDVVYQEIQSPTTDANGLINIQLGSGKVIEGNYAGIDWMKGPYYIKTETNLSGATKKFKSSDKSMIVACALYASNPAAELALPPANATKNALLTPPKPHYIGEFFEGGVVFYLNKDAAGKEHGLIVGIKDLSPAFIWSNVAQQIGPRAESTFDGKSNTLAIVSQDGHKESAAMLCDTSTLGEQTDWYLPSMQELNMLWNSLNAVNRALSQDENPETVAIDDAIYWSSTEDDATTFAWYFGMYDGGPGDTAGTNYKSETYHVRAIRAF